MSRFQKDAEQINSSIIMHSIKALNLKELELFPQSGRIRDVLLPAVMFNRSTHSHHDLPSLEVTAGHLKE